MINLYNEILNKNEIAEYKTLQSEGRALFKPSLIETLKEFFAKLVGFKTENLHKKDKFFEKLKNKIEVHIKDTIRLESHPFEEKIKNYTTKIVYIDAIYSIYLHFAKNDIKNLSEIQEKIKVVFKNLNKNINDREEAKKNENSKKLVGTSIIQAPILKSELLKTSSSNTVTSNNPIPSHIPGENKSKIKLITDEVKNKTTTWQEYFGTGFSKVFKMITVACVVSSVTYLGFNGLSQLHASSPFSLQNYKINHVVSVNDHMIFNQNLPTPNFPSPTFIPTNSNAAFGSKSHISKSYRIPENISKMTKNDFDDFMYSENDDVEETKNNFKKYLKDEHTIDVLNKQGWQYFIYLSDSQLNYLINHFEELDEMTILQINSSYGYPDEFKSFFKKYFPTVTIEKAIKILNSNLITSNYAEYLSLEQCFEIKERKLDQFKGDYKVYSRVQQFLSKQAIELYEKSKETFLDESLKLSFNPIDIPTKYFEEIIPLTIVTSSKNSPYHHVNLYDYKTYKNLMADNSNKKSPQVNEEVAKNRFQKFIENEQLVKILNKHGGKYFKFTSDNQLNYLVNNFESLGLTTILQMKYADEIKYITFEEKVKVLAKTDDNKQQHLMLVRYNEGHFLEKASQRFIAWIREEGEDRRRAKFAEFRKTKN